METYQPKTIDTSNVELPDDLKGLVEMLAKNTHDHWAMLRMTQGWTYGPNRNDEAKQHPDLIEYNELPESEKEYDRRSATEAIKAIMTLGFDIKFHSSGN